MESQRANQPNIIFILIDDLGWRDLSCYGSEYYETPHIDQLFRDGMHFTNAYAACPVCSPTRASILTGKYPANVGVTDWIGAHTQGKLIDAPYIDHLPANEISLAKALQTNGFKTWHVGKWHLGGDPYLPENHGFDVNIGGSHWGHPKNGYFSPWEIETLPDDTEGEYLTDRLTTEAIRLIEQNEGTPFFLNMWYYSVHTPIEAKAKTIEKYKQKAKRLGLDKISPFEVGEHFPCLHKRDQHIIRRTVQSDPVYAAMIEHLDENIGRLIAAVDDKGLTENTMIVFTSDNGGLSTAEGSPTCNFPLAEGKGWMYEGGTREPLIIKWPGHIQPGSVCHTPVTSPDFYPTFLEATQNKMMPTQHQDGCSLLPLFRGEKDINRGSIFWHYPHYGNQGGTPGCAIRSGQYKLIEFFEDNRLELYDLSTDIGEEHNLSETHPDLTDALHARLTVWRKQMRALTPQPNPEWNELD